MGASLKNVKVLAIPDLHLRWVNRYQLSKVYKLVKDKKPDIIIQLGDLYEFYNFSKFSRDLNHITPKAEIRKSQEMAYDFWDNIKKISKDSKKIQLMGNHDMRLQKRILERFPEINNIFDLREEFYDFDEVDVKRSDRDYVEFDNVVYCHGWLIKRWSHVRYFNKSVVHAHTHRASLIVRCDDTTEYKYMFELDGGHLINKHALPFTYTPTKYSKWKEGCCFINRGKPELIML